MNVHAYMVIFSAAGCGILTLCYYRTLSCILLNVPVEARIIRCCFHTTLLEVWIDDGTKSRPPQLEAVTYIVQPCDSESPVCARCGTGDARCWVFSILRSICLPLHAMTTFVLQGQSRGCVTAAGLAAHARATCRRPRFMCQCLENLVN